MKEEFINMLLGLHRTENRGALAKLRRGLGKQPGEAMEVYSLIGSFAANTKSKAEEVALYTVATLFGLYPSDSSEEESSNFGSSVSELAEKSDSKSIEARFVALLNSHVDDLPNHLRQMIGLLKSKEVRVNWLQLLRDIHSWDRDDREVQRRWAKAFRWQQD